MYINNNGISSKTNMPPVDKLQVDICTKYLEEVIEKNEYNKITSSYELKHVIDSNIGYVSNGAFIKALDDLKMNYEICSNESQDVWVKFNSSDLKRAILKVKYKNIELNDPDDFLLLSIIDHSRTVGFRATIGQITLIINQYTLKDKNNEYTYKVLSEIKLLKFNIDNGSMINLNDIDVNISKNKLKELLKRKFKQK